jgi:hypothetical protein
LVRKTDNDKGGMVEAEIWRKMAEPEVVSAWKSTNDFFRGAGGWVVESWGIDG